ncbi:MAG: roadblock/LC7 domain-containing protein [Deltaproteobacteria bacterium]|nr:roadblock/LC7 domain-containing protein [Deltaproteobacteria bacterium]
MPFKKYLAPLTEMVSGESGAILVDGEGEVVDMVGRMERYRLQVTAAHCVILCHQFRRLTARLGGLELEELRIGTDAFQVLVCPVDADYFLVFFHQRDPRNADRARLAAGRVALALKKELY